MILLISAGRGPIECREAVANLGPKVVAICEDRGVRVLDAQAFESPPGSPPSSLAITVTDTHLLDDLVGTHCVISPSARRGKRSRKRWFVGVSAHCPVVEPIKVRAADVEFSATTARGPGGQAVNKTASAVRAHHRPSGVVVFVQDTRSQHQNRTVAIERITQALQRQKAVAEARAKDALWSAHNALERGNPVRTWRMS